jgi:hypothetical protein
MTLPVWVVIPAGISLLAFVIFFFAFRQSMQVTSQQEGNPPEHYGGDFHA